MPLFELNSSSLFRVDALAGVMAGLILFVITNVLAYSGRYLAGDRNQQQHRLYVLLLTATVMAMVFADHLLLFFAAWTASNLLLAKLMIHKAEWIAARNSGLLALKTFGFGTAALAVGFFLLAQGAGTASIEAISQNAVDATPGEFAGLLLIAIAAMTQSAAWPFHRWLISSLNSPTPVSALMHAGLINGGGFLLVRFAPLFAAQHQLLHGLFLAGLVTAVVGTFWKLLQTDIKRMLACSTMGQMGFMLMQCGMGLFAPAISHLCWHGLFKAYLFLSCGSVVREKPKSLPADALSPSRMLIACLVGVCGAQMFSLACGIKPSFKDTSCLMTALAFMASTQLAIGLLDKSLIVSRVLAAFGIGLGAGGLYGLSIRAVETTLASLHLMQPQPLDSVYFAGLAIIFIVWIGMIFNLPIRLKRLPLWKRLYMAALNASQPHPNTITTARSSYQS